MHDQQMTGEDDQDFTAPAVDPRAVKLGDAELRGTVFVVPVSAPIPSELGTAKVAEGTLYERLSPICTENYADGEFCFAPLSGAELIAMDRVWPLIKVAAKVHVLGELPGARYDVMFTMAARQLGLKLLAWPEVSASLEDRARTVQRTRDTRSWELGDIEQTQRQPSPRRAPRTMGKDITLNVPEASGEEVQE